MPFTRFSTTLALIRTPCARRAEIDPDLRTRGNPRAISHAGLLCRFRGKAPLEIR